MPKRFSVWVGVFLILACSATFPASSAYADDPASTNFRFNETSIGTGGMLESNSANYQARGSSGDLGIGNSASGNYQIDAGTITTNNPRLAVSVNGSVPLGSFSPNIATTGSSTFSVLNYTAFGYVVNIIGSPPTNNGHEIAPIAPNSPPALAPYTEDSSEGFEQFGINLVENTLPAVVGHYPDNGNFGFGEAAPMYDTENEYRYVSGETIASAPKSSGVTTYTISYLVNVGALTPAGKYTTSQTIIVTGTY